MAADVKADISTLNTKYNITDLTTDDIKLLLQSTPFYSYG